MKPFKTPIFSVALALFFQVAFALSHDLGNQGDTLTFARAFADGEWLKDDWYLSLNIGYRNLFNLIFGNLYAWVGLKWTVIIGELLIAPLYIYVVHKLFEKFQIKHFLLPLFVVLSTLKPSLFANEWLIGDLDTKVFSYLFAILGLLSLGENKVKRTLIFFGLACSFHVLIGGYIFLACVTAFILTEEKKNILPYFKYSFLFFLAGANSLFFIWEWLANSNITTDQASIINELLIRTRLSHHLWPVGISCQDLSIKLILFLSAITYSIKNRPYLKKVMLILLTYLILGFLIGLAQKHSLMKFYLFRTPDTLIPFFGLACLIQTLNKFLDQKRHNLALLLGSITLFSALTWNHLPLRDISLTKPKEKKLFTWIKENTDENSTFLIPPKWKYFYLFAERSQFVSYKHLPQNNKDIWEWRSRLLALNCNLEKPKSSRELKNELKSCFKKLDASAVEKLKAKYRLDYIITKKDFSSEYKEVFKSKTFRVYEL